MLGAQRPAAFDAGLGDGAVEVVPDRTDELGLVPIELDDAFDGRDARENLIDDGLRPAAVDGAVAEVVEPDVEGLLLGGGGAGHGGDGEGAEKQGESEGASGGHGVAPVWGVRRERALIRRGNRGEREAVRAD